MEKRFETRKREMAQDAKIDKKDRAGALRRLDTFLKPFFEDLPRTETRENATTFVKGLLADIQRKNIESIASRFGQERRALQRFIGEAAWDHQVILDRLATQAVKRYGEEDGVLACDPSAFEKDGKMSAGVARQYLGRFRHLPCRRRRVACCAFKTAISATTFTHPAVRRGLDNGPVGTFCAYVTRKGHALVNGKLFIPQEWNDDPARCERAHIPEEEYKKPQTRHRHCLEMLDHQGGLLPHAWITGDDELGRSSGFRWERRKRNEYYVLAVPCDTNIRDKDLAPESKGRGAVPKGKFYRVDAWKASAMQAIGAAAPAWTIAAEVASLPPPACRENCMAVVF